MVRVLEVRPRLGLILFPAALVAGFLFVKVQEPWTYLAWLAATAIALVTVATWIVIGAPGGSIDWPAAVQQIRPQARKVVIGVSLAAVIAIGVGIALVPVVPGGVWSGLFFILGLVLWLMAVAVHVTASGFRSSDALTPVAKGCISVVVALWAPLVVWATYATQIAWGAIIVAALFAATMTARIGIAVARGRGAVTPGNAPVREQWWRRLKVVSVGLGVAAGGFALATAGSVLAERTSVDTSQVARLGTPLVPPAKRPGWSKARYERALEVFYRPALRLDSGEQWPEASAVTYWKTQASPTGGTDGCPLPPTRGARPSGAFRRVQTPCLTLETHSAVADHSPPVGPDSAVIRGGVEYPRLVPVTETDRVAAVKINPDARALIKPTTAIIEYWLFYPFDRSTFDTPLGTVVQEHGGDWEWVGVGLAKDREPVWVSYSEHCAGVLRPWESVPVVNIDDRSSTVVIGGRAQLSHPLTVVARGSHANYPTTGTREPDWANCTGLERHKTNPVSGAALRALSFAAGARDPTPTYGPIQLPNLARTNLAAYVETAPWYWGQSDQTTLDGIDLLASTPGPESPEYQPNDVWNSPLSVVFDNGWDCQHKADISC